MAAVLPVSGLGACRAALKAGVATFPVGSPPSQAWCSYFRREENTAADVMRAKAVLRSSVRALIKHSECWLIFLTPPEKAQGEAGGPLLPTSYPLSVFLSKTHFFPSWPLPTRPQDGRSAAAVLGTGGRGERARPAQRVWSSCLPDRAPRPVRCGAPGCSSCPASVF